eukprot:jgi/Mesvir1/29498/Mv19748-RA.1
MGMKAARCLVLLLLSSTWAAVIAEDLVSAESVDAVDISKREENAIKPAPRFGFACPPGSYDAADSIQKKNAKLAAWVAWLREKGSQEMPGSDLNTALARDRIWVYPDAMWPKPARCAALAGRSSAVTTSVLKSHCTINSHAYLLEHTRRFIVNLVWKAGSTSLVSALRSLFPNITYVDHTEQLVAKTIPACIRNHGHVAPRWLPPRSGRYAHVGMVRDPLDRFVSAFREAYLRDVFQKKVSVAMRVKKWLRRAAEAHVASQVRADTAGVLRMLTNAVMSAECGVYDDVFPVSGYHMQPIPMFFTARQVTRAGKSTRHGGTRGHGVSLGSATGGTDDDNDSPEERGPEEQMSLDILIREESLAEDLTRMLAWAKPVANGSVIDGLVQGALVAKRSGEAKDPFLPSAVLLKSFLMQRPMLLRRLCIAYMQDYVCFDYQLPETCQGMAPFAAWET